MDLKTIKQISEKIVEVVNQEPTKYDAQEKVEEILTQHTSSKPPLTEEEEDRFNETIERLIP